MNPQNDRNADDVMDYRMILPLREKCESVSGKHLNLMPSVASVSALPLAASSSSCSGRLKHRRNHYGRSSSAGKATYSTFQNTVMDLIWWVNKPFIHPENHLQTAAGVFLLDWVLWTPLRLIRFSFRKTADESSFISRVLGKINEWNVCILRVIPKCLSFNICLLCNKSEENKRRLILIFPIPPWIPFLYPHLDTLAVLSINNTPC